jgi:hypothetical protein
MSYPDPHVTEPMTMITDYLLAGFAAALALLLLRKARRERLASVFLWVLAFFVATVAALAGGTAHGFKLYLGEANHAVIWRITVVSIGLTALLMLIAGIRSAIRPTTTVSERRRRGHQWLKRGLLVSIIGLLLLQRRWGLHEHFNHNDIYHLIQMVGIYFFYRGAVLLHDLEN